MSIVCSDYAKTETGAFDVFFGNLMQFTILKYRIKMFIYMKSNIYQGVFSTGAMGALAPAILKNRLLEVS